MYINVTLKTENKTKQKTCPAVCTMAPRQEISVYLSKSAWLGSEDDTVPPNLTGCLTSETSSTEPRFAPPGQAQVKPWFRVSPGSV